MGAAYSVSPESLTSERIYEILFEIDQTAPLQSFPTDAAGDPVTWIDSRLTGAPAPLFPMPQLTENLELQPAVLHLTGGNATPLLDGFA